MHDVEFCSDLRQLVEHTLPTLLELKAEGKIRYIGVNGYNIGVLKKIVENSPPNSIDTILSYSRMTLFNKGKVQMYVQLMYVLLYTIFEFEQLNGIV